MLEIKGLGDGEGARKLWKKLKGYHHNLDRQLTIKLIVFGENINQNFRQRVTKNALFGGIQRFEVDESCEVF